jgi:hypothetical protein
MLCYIYDCNNIKVVPIKSRSDSEWVNAYDGIHQELTVKGLKPNLQTLDNEESTALKNFFTVNNNAYQLVPPQCNRRNATERAIRTFKEQFVAGLSSVDPSFPMHVWDRLLPQAEITLNLLRTSHLYPQLSATAHYHGLVDYNKTSFSPPGCIIIAHENPGMRRAWAPHGRHGYSLGPAMHHYRCQNVYISTTTSERIVDTLELFPHNYQMPQLSSTNRLLMAANDMTDAFQNPHPDIPFARVGDDTVKDLADLAAIFKLKLQQSPSLATLASPAKVVQHPIIIPLPTQISDSSMPDNLQTRSKTTTHTPDIPDRPLPPRVIAPRTLHHSPPRVPTGSQQLSPRNLSQDDFCGIDTAHMAIALGNNHWSQHHHASAVIHPVTGKKMEYSSLMKDPSLQQLWTQGFGNECGRLFQGFQDIPGTSTCLFTTLKNIQEDIKITYGKIFKQEKECVRLTVGGDKLDYAGDVATSTADITTLNILINSTLYTEDAAMMMMDIKNYYLGIPLPRFEYMKMLLSRFPKEIIQK